MEVIFTLLILVALHYGDATISCCSVCDCKPHEVWCEYRGLAEVPVDIPTSTRRLYLFNNNISTIPDGVFDNLKKLELLDLSSNLLPSEAIKPGMLSGLERLTDVILTGNKLNHIRENTFTDVPSLVRLYLENNEIRLIDEHAFTNLINLVELKMSRNRLSDFPKFINSPNLRRLCLSHNNFVRLQAETFSEVNLEQLTLSNNKFNQLPSTIFQEVSNMRKLDLSRNRISNIPRIINQMNSLQTLNLSGNSISFMPANFLSNLRRMKVLDLSDLQLTTLPNGFIPPRVYLNVFGIFNNPWTCDCRISWLTEYMRIVGDAFVGMSQVRCSGPNNLQGRQLVTLHEKDLNCDSDTEKPQAENETPAFISCNDLTCFHEAQCLYDYETNMPYCRCQHPWKGVLCNEPDKENFFRGLKIESFIQKSTVTSTSVEISLPTINMFLTISATELREYGREPEKKITTLLSLRSSYRITNLKPGTSYRICIKSAKSTLAWDEPYPGFEDALLCGNVTTQMAGFPSENKTPLDDDEMSDSHSNAGQRENQIHTNDDEKKITTESNSSKLLFPVLAACIGICIIAGIGAFFCYRNAKRKSQGTDISESMSEYRSEKLQYASEDAVPMMRQHCDYTLIPKSYSGESTTSTHLSDDVYQLPLPQRDVFPHPHQQRDDSCRISYEHKNADYRKCSHGNFSQNNTLEAQRYHDKSTMPPEAVQFNKGQQFEDMYRLNNSRQEYTIEPKYAALQTNFSSETGRGASTVPVSSHKHFNELYHGPDVKDCGYVVGSIDQVHNSLKLRSSFRDFVPPQLSHSLRLNSEQKMHRNEHQQTEYHNLNARSVTPHQVYGPIMPGQKTMVI